MSLCYPKEWPRRRLSSMPSADTVILTEPLPCFDLAPDGPKFSTHAGPSPPSLQSNALGQADFDIRGSSQSPGRLVHLCPPMTGASPALVFPPGESELARPRSKRRLHTLQACRPRLSSPDASGPPWMNMTRILRFCRSRVPQGADFADESDPSSQRAISSMSEARAFIDFMASDQVEVHTKAHLVLNCSPGAGA